jgi:AraC-like DNA-binding protein
VHLPEGAGKSFWLNGSAWPFPSFDNVDTFVHRLIRQGILTREPLVEAALRGSVHDLNARSLQRRFLRTMGVPLGTLFQIERALQALKLLQSGTPILDVVEQAGYYDQPHLTRSLRQLVGQTPAQILTLRSDE